MNININLHRSLFNDSFFPHLNPNERFQLFYGGAGGGKSVFLAQRAVIRSMTDKKSRLLVLRKVARTSRYSAFLEISLIIHSWGLSKLFTIHKSDMTITCKVNSNQILFVGLDDPEKLKSIAQITDIWIEESTELARDEFDTVNLRLRSPYGRNQIALSFNPISGAHWLKDRFFDSGVECLKHHSTHRDNIFLPDEYRNQLEYLQELNPDYYDVYALGQWGELGDLVLTNWVTEDFQLDRRAVKAIVQGIDWRFNDPSVFIKLAIAGNNIFILDARYFKRLTNTQLMAEGERFFDRSFVITADSSEPARIQEWRNHGFNIRGARKEKGSIKHGIDYLKRNKIHVKPDQVELVKELQTYSYKKDRDGRVFDEPIDLNNHGIDAIRYSLEDYIFAQHAGAFDAGFIR